MLKSQDIVLLLKLLADKSHLDWTQQQLAEQLCVSSSVINGGLKRLSQSQLIHLGLAEKRYRPVLAACEEFLISGVRYAYPARLGQYTRGVVTSYAAPIFEKHILLGQDPIPVWPYTEGAELGLALEPLAACVPKSITKYPDKNFYELLVLVDAIRQGRSRERNIATQLLKEKLHANS